VIAFWALAPLMVLAALGMVLVRKAVHSALLLAFVMVSLAILYAAQEAPFLFAVQIIVYTGAILMLFLFVLMLVGVDSSDSVVETIPGQRLAATVVGLLFGLVLVLGIAQATISVGVGLGEVNSEGNVDALAQLLFSRYVLAFEVTSALLITAALGAMVLAHRERLTPKETQATMAAQRMRDYASSGKHLGPLPTPGVYARHNAVDTPALLPDGSTSPLSVSRSLQARGVVRTGSTTDVDRTTAEMAAALDPGVPSADHTERGGR
jgi:NADH-quinone oxidoreductase subunit J